MAKQKIEDFFAFIEECPTAFHAIDVIQRKLIAEGFKELDENKLWDVRRGGKYFVKRNDSSLISFIVPILEIAGIHMVAAHTDSPAFKVKANPEISENAYVKLNTEKYGGMILSTWLDRPLSVAGRIFVEGESGGIEQRLVHVDRDLLVIPNLAIHMNRDINQGFSYNPQVDMLPIFSDEKERKLLDVIALEAGISKEKILSDDLFVYVRQKGCLVGEDGQWMMSPRLDDLECVYAALEGMLSADPQEYIALSAFFDSEEVGSGTRQGAGSEFLAQTISGIAGSLAMTKVGHRKLLTGSFMVSADNAHAVHPNHPEKADPTNRPKMNGGIVIKFHGGQKYTTDGYSSAYMAKLCREAGVEYQTYYNRSDIAGGSTLGNISTAHVSVPSVDIGFAQLAMHSAVETAGREDIFQGISLFEHYWSK
ncbi:M18 family aminopeptidase [bacterium 1xD8-6]|nr:M18 family aminopeptidase [bacterium D16-36]RKI72421.1 M18 family aminopeptidase [bacterium 1xD8-6]